MWIEGWIKRRHLGRGRKSGAGKPGGGEVRPREYWKASEGKGFVGEKGRKGRRVWRAGVVKGVEGRGLVARKKSCL